MQAGLAGRLRTQTSELHRQAESAGIMPDFLRGRLERKAYCALLRNLHGIYAALEPALHRNASDPRLAAICLPELDRRAAIESDLVVLHGAGWADDLDVTATCDAYVRRLREIERADVGLLAAHAYVRYLGDLSGGQILRRIVADAYGPEGERGASFYEFAQPGAAELAQRFRAGLDKLRIDDSAAERIVSEATQAFVLHVRLFDELDDLRENDAAPGNLRAGNDKLR